MSSGAMYDVTVIGEIYQDHVFCGFERWPGPGEEIFTEEYAWELGGGAVITACALARLGRRVQVIGVVGEEDLPRIASRLGEFGVSAEGLVPSPLRTGVTVSISTAEDRSFFTHRGANDALPGLFEEDEALLRRAGGARHIHLAMPLSTQLAMTVLPELRRQGATLSLDVGHHVGWLQDEASLGVLSVVDYCLPNEKEAALMSGSAEAYLEQSRRLGIRNAVVKLGRAGAVMLRDAVEYRAASPEVKVVDTTGAGDVFDAGLIDGLLDEKSPRGLLEQACVCGALSTRAAGALGALPDRAEVAALMRETYGS